MPHREKVQEAKKAINAVFTDTSVSVRETLNSLEELQEEIGMYIAAVQRDVDAEENSANLE
jgi:3'-phosphoadenosine 5'-phosphosulfate sulfotransferase (PAPS reductase)/FAD synthetase